MVCVVPSSVDGGSCLDFVYSVCFFVVVRVVFFFVMILRQSLLFRIPCSSLFSCLFDWCLLFLFFRLS